MTRAIAGSRSHTILIVDDDPEILAFYRKIFSAAEAPDLDILDSSPAALAADLACRTFSDPQDFLKEFERTVRAGERHPLCILDMRMPILNGLATAVRVREIDPAINVVICTAFSDVPLDEIRAKLRDGIFFVHKPFVVEEFSLLIHSLVGHWNTQQELKRTQADLTAQSDQLALMLEGTRAGTWDWTIPDGQVEFNERWAEIVGYELRELAPLNIETWTRLCHPDDLVKSGEMLGKVFSGEIAYYDCECRMRHKNGGWVWVWDRGKVTEWSPEGKPLRMLGTHFDITLKRQTMEIKSRLISVASHEFRTPLATIRLAADLLFSRRDKMDAVGIQRALQTILDATDSMTDVVTDVLDLSSIDRTVQIEPISKIPLAEFLSQITEEFNSSAPHAARLTFEWQGPPANCDGVPSLLKRSVNNLLDNAAKYSPAGTPIVLRLQRGKTAAVIQVEDRGIGVPEDQALSLQEPFFRASNTAGIPGTGLGLAIASEAMQRMGGTIAYASSPAGGSIFSIELPLAADGARALEDLGDGPGSAWEPRERNGQTDTP